MDLVIREKSRQVRRLFAGIVSSQKRLHGSLVAGRKTPQS